jgi:glutathione S-transferase
MLRLCGAGFRSRYVSFQRRMHLTPEFRALSRWGQVPVLEHDGRVLLQSAAILEYLSETFNRFGGDGPARQDIRELAVLGCRPPVSATLRLVRGRSRRRKLPPLSFDDAIVARWEALGEAALGVLDAHLAVRPFLVGAEPTIADIASYADVAFARLSGRNFAQWSNVAAWAAGIEALSTFAASFDLLAMHDADIAP